MKKEDQNESIWPMNALLIFGYYGYSSPGAKKFIITILLSLVLFLTGFITMQLVADLSYKVAGFAILLFGLAISIHAQYKYLRGLDSLNKNIQLSGFAFSYAAVFLICMVLMSIETITGYMPSMLWILLAEPARGIALFKITRGYQ